MNEVENVLIPVIDLKATANCTAHSAIILFKKAKPTIITDSKTCVEKAIEEGEEAATPNL